MDASKFSTDRSHDVFTPDRGFDSKFIDGEDYLNSSFDSFYNTPLKNHENRGAQDKLSHSGAYITDSINAKYAVPTPVLRLKPTLDKIYQILDRHESEQITNDAEFNSSSYSDFFLKTKINKAHASVKTFYENVKSKNRCLEKPDNEKHLRQMIDTLEEIAEALNEINQSQNTDQIADVSQYIEIARKMHNLISMQNTLLVAENKKLILFGTILKIMGYVLMTLVALATVMAIAGVTFPVLLVSLAVTVKANCIVSHAINTVSAIVAYFGVNLSVGAAAATTTAVFASAVTMFGKAAQVCGRASQLMLDKNQAAADIADVAEFLQKSS